MGRLPCLGDSLRPETKTGCQKIAGKPTCFFAQSPLFKSAKLELRPVLREAGIDVETKEGRTAYQAINRWSGGRERKPRKGQRKGQPGDFFPRTLKLEYRELLFKYIRIKHRTEYIKPLPPGETWITSDEMASWLEDFYNSGQPGEPVQEW